MSSNHFRVLFAAFGKRGHELSKTIAADLVVKAELDARLIRGATQRDKLLVVESFMMAFVESAFVTEASVVAGIRAGSITTTAEIDAANWPANG